MKKLITLLSTLTITSSIIPLTAACKTTVWSSNQNGNSNPKPTTKTDKEKIKDAKDTLKNFKNVKISEAKIDKLKAQIKSQIKANLNQEDGVTIKGDIKICKKDDASELKNNDITINEIDIIVTGQFKSENLTEQFILNTKVKLNFVKGINIDEVTTDMIINWKDEYFGKNNKDENITVKPEKLGILNNDSIRSILNSNLKTMIRQKLIGIDKTKLDDLENNKFFELSSTEKSNFEISEFVMNYLIEHNVKPIYNQNSKKFIADIKVVKWDETNEKNRLTLEVDIYKNAAKKFLALSYKEQKAIFSKQGMKAQEIEQAIKNNIIFFKKWQQVNLDSIKSMYNLIKGTNKTIEFDLTDKQ